VPPHRTLATVIFTVALAACSGGDEKAAPTMTSAAAQSAAVALNMLLSKPTSGALGSQPTALLGVHVATYLAHGPSAISAALRSAQIQAAFQRATPTADQAYLVLQQLGAAVQIDVHDLLNRSTDRRKTLDQYLAELRKSKTAAEGQVQVLESQADELENTQDEQNDRARTIDRDLSKALRDKDYANAARKQEELKPAQEALQKTELEQEEVESLLDIFVDLLELTDERLNAIEKNREVLIAGHTVVEVPGIDDLGVLQREKRRRLGL
jgi:hypothetical protein